MVDVEKLLAAITETERKALAIPLALRTERWSDPGPWVMHGGGAGLEVAIARPEMPIAEKVAEHIGHHDPVAVLRRCAVDRRTVERHSTIRDAVFSTSPGKPGVWLPKCFYCNRRAPCDDLRDMMDRYGIAEEA